MESGEMKLAGDSGKGGEKHKTSKGKKGQASVAEHSACYLFSVCISAYSIRLTSCCTLVAPLRSFLRVLLLIETTAYQSSNNTVDKLELRYFIVSVCVNF